MFGHGYVSKHGHAYDCLKVKVALFEPVALDLFLVLPSKQEWLRFVIVQVCHLPRVHTWSKQPRTP